MRQRCTHEDKVINRSCKIAGRSTDYTTKHRCSRPCLPGMDICVVHATAPEIENVIEELLARVDELEQIQGKCEV